MNLNGLSKETIVPNKNDKNRAWTSLGRREISSYTPIRQSDTQVKNLNSIQSNYESIGQKREALQSQSVMRSSYLSSSHVLQKSEFVYNKTQANWNEHSNELFEL